MTSIERVLTTITHQEPDQIPLFLFLSLYGAKELDMTPIKYFSKAENIVKAQLIMKEKYTNDCIYTFFYAPIEVEAFGGEVLFVDDGPPNSRESIIKDFKDIDVLKVPDIKSVSCLCRVLEATSRLKDKVNNTVPIIGVVMSPFSLPVMQMGFEKYLELIYFHQDHFKILMKKNAAFCISWANAQIQAGATAICYFNPLASPAMIEKETYLSTGYPIDRDVLSKINGPTATHLASAMTLPVLDEIANTGTVMLGFSSNDDVNEIKEAATNRICLLGNLNGIEMVNWNQQKVHNEVKNLVVRAGNGGGFVLSDSHGEVPWQVPEKVLLEIAEAVQCYGTYPLEEVLGDE